MILKTKKNETKKSSKQTKSTKDNKNKINTKICKNYNDTSEYDIKYSAVELSKLRYNMIDYCEVNSVKIEDGNIELSGSWVELLIIMAGAFIEKYKDLNEKLIEFNITSQTFCIDRKYGKYDLTSSARYRAYKIYDTGYYLESTFESDCVFKALIGFTQALEIPFNKIIFNLHNIRYKELCDNFYKLEDTERVLSIFDDEVKDLCRKGVHLTGVDILGNYNKVHRMDVVFYLFCNWVFDEYDSNMLLRLEKVGKTGITLNDVTNNTKYEFINNCGIPIKVYTDCNTSDIIDFIRNSIEIIGISEDTIKLKFRFLKENTKPYEL